jgi:hypothetical protein
MAAERLYKKVKTNNHVIKIPSGSPISARLKKTFSKKLPII